LDLEKEENDHNYRIM